MPMTPTYLFVLIPNMTIMMQRQRLMLPEKRNCKSTIHPLLYAFISTGTLDSRKPD